MKKRLLLMFAAALGLTSSFAYEVGDYVYTPNGRFKITGTNLVKNGDFTDGLNNWTNLYCQPLSPDTFAVTDDGPDGRKCLTTLQGAMSVTNWGYQCANFAQDITLPANTTYLCTYKVKAYVPNMSSVGIYGRYYNHQNFVFPKTPGVYPLKGGDGNESGKISGGIFGFSSCSDKWEERTMDYRTEANDTTMSVLFFELVPNDSYTDFGIYEARQVFDDRIALETATYIEALVNDEANFPNGDRDGLKMVITDLRGMVGTDMSVSEFADTYKNIMGADGPVTAFLNENSADVSSYYENFTLDDASEQGTGKTTTPAKGWTATNNRWGVNAPGFNLMTNHLKSDNSANGNLAASSVSQGAHLPAGKYFYVVRGLGYKMGANGKGKKDNYYIPDYYSQIDGLKYFLNNDSVEMTDLQTSYAKMYMNIFEVKEDGDQTLGFAYPAIPGADTGAAPPTGHTGSATFRLDNVEIRILGKTEKEVELHFIKKTLEAKREDLAASIAAAKETADNKKYLFYNSVLRDSIATSEAVFAAATEATQENIDIVVEQKNNMDKAVRAYTRANVEYVKLGEDIELCKTELADENRTKGKETFSAAINVADTYYKAQVETSRDSATIMLTDSTLLAARYDYQLVNASYNSPADVPLVNNSFQRKNAEGWEEDGGAADPGKANWKFSDNADMTDGYQIYFNRGYSQTNEKWVWQDVEIPTAGAYRFEAEAIVTNSKWTAGTTAETDTYLFIGSDSLMIATPSNGSGNQDYQGNVTKFTITKIIEDINTLDQAGVIRVGLERKPTIQLGHIYLGSCHLYYLGSKEDYENGISDVNNAATLNNGDIYTINGVKVRANANSLKGLAKGIYIMNGKKYVVK